MNSKFVKKVLILVLSLMAQASLSNTSDSADTLSGLVAYSEADSAGESITGRYALPPSKVYIEPCQQEALRLHPGTIEEQQILHRHGDFWAQYDIQTPNGSEWFVLCDLASGKVIREQKLIDDGF